MKKNLLSQRIKLLFCALLLGYSTLSAQEFNTKLIPVDAMSNPWAGGLNTPQFSEIDLDGDQYLDLYAFDRVGNVHITFINNGIEGEVAYTYAPEYSKNFPTCTDWVALRDYNGDGLMDIFTQNDVPDGIKVFKGIINAEGEIDFVPYDNVDCDDEYLCVDIGGGFKTNIYSSYVDYPAIVDVDEDGDLDILNFDSGSTFVVWYENISNDPEVLKFGLSEFCWGGFAETALSQTIFMNLEDSISCVELFMENEDDASTASIHPGSTLLVFDEDLDGDKDILIGDVTNLNMVFLKNNGSITNAWMTEQDVQYPSYDQPISISQFPMAFNMDFDNDGLKDLMATNNNNVGIENYNVSWFYKMSIDGTEVNYNLQETSILTDEQLDFGSGSSPAVFDYDGDGLWDILVGTDGYFDNNNKDPRLILLKNVGTATEPSFEIADYDFLGFSSYQGEAWLFAPTFGDMDADGDMDLLVGEKSGKIIYCENIAGAGNPVQYANPIYDWKEIDVGQKSKPFVIDLDRDGDNDLVIGEQLGNLNFIRNTGTPTDFQCDPDQNAEINNSSLGQIDATTGQVNDIVGNSVPFFLEVNGQYELVLGTEKDGLRHYNNVNNNLGDGQSFNSLSDSLAIQSVGFSGSPHLADLDNDGYLDMIIGNLRGGLQLYSSDWPAEYLISSDKEVYLNTLNLSVYPNPGNGVFNISMPFEEDLDELIVINPLGQIVMKSYGYQLDISSFPSGVYTLVVRSESGLQGQLCLVKD